MFVFNYHRGITLNLVNKFSFLNQLDTGNNFVNNVKHVLDLLV